MKETGQAGVDARQGIQKFDTAVSSANRSSKDFEKQIKNFDRGLGRFSTAMGRVSAFANTLALTIGGPLIASAVAASKTNVELNRSFQEISKTSKLMTDSIGQSLVPVVQQFSGFIKNLADRWLELPKAQRDSIVQNAAWAAAILFAIGLVAKYAQRITGLRRALIALTDVKIPAALTALGGGSVAGGLAAGGVALAGGADIMNDLNDKVLKPGVSAGKRVAGTIKIIGDRVKGFFNLPGFGLQKGMEFASKFTKQPAPQSVAGTFGGGIGGLVEASPEASGLVQSAFTNIDKGGEGAGKGVADVKAATDQVRQFVTNLKTEMDTVFGEIAVNTKTIAQTIAQTLGTAFTQLTAGIGEAVAQSIVFGKSFEESMKSILKNIAAQMISTLVSAIAQIVLLRALGVFGPISTFALGLGGGPGGGGSGGGEGGEKGGGGFLGGIGKLFGFAEGGVVTKPTVGMVGEAGPEAIVPLDQMGQMGGSVTVNILGPTFFEDESAMDKFVRKTSEALKRASIRRTGGTAIAL